MKKLFFCAIAMMFGLGAHAQQSQSAVGVNLSYPSDLKSPGIGVKAWYGFTDAIRAQASFDYFLKKDGVSAWDLNLDAHYLFSVGEQLKVYPLAGLSYLHSKVSVDIPTMTVPGTKIEGGNVSASDGNFGVNLGGGVQYDLTETLALNGELKYQIIKDASQVVFTVGLAYKF